MGFIKVRMSGNGLHLRGLFMVLLLALLCAGIYWLTKTVGRALREPARLELYYKGARRFSEESKAVYLKGIAGLWTYDLEMMTAGRPIKKRDRLEIKDNGIIWEIVEWETTMPAGTTESFFQIRTAFICPYGTCRGDTLSDVYILSQAFIGESDTCFGGYNFSELWQMAGRGEGLVIAKRYYRPYRGAVEDFFPSGLVLLVENSEKQLYYDTVADGVRETRLNSVFHIRKTDPGTGAVSLFPIRDSLNDLAAFFRLKLENAYAADTSRTFDGGQLAELLEKYYQPFIVDEQWRLFPRGMPRKVQVNFMITVDGVVDSVRFPPADDYGRMLTVDFARQVRSWRFPRPDEVIHTSHTFTMP